MGIGLNHDENSYIGTRCGGADLTKPVVDPFGTTLIEDYSKLFDLFGIEPTEPLIPRFPKPNRYLRRRIDFGHRDLQKILQALEEGSDYAVMSGIKPTGEFHLGSKMTAEEIVYFQGLSRRARAFYCIADVEAYADNGIPMDKSVGIAVDNVADILALGLDPDRAHIYKQSTESRVSNLAFIFSRGVTRATLEAIYGEKPFGLYLSALVQAADILMPELSEFGGPKAVIVPVGADQDPHIRLTRDLARRFQEQFKFVLPGAVYHKLIRSLSGEVKMSKRDPMSLLTLNDPPELAEKKVLSCLTGGRSTAEEQRRLGGEIQKCVNYELALFHFIEDDRVVEKVYRECVTGARLCGECKAEVAGYVVRFLEGHQARKRSLRDVAVRLLAP